MKELASIIKEEHSINMLLTKIQMELVTIYFLNRDPEEDSEIVFSIAMDKENVSIDDPTLMFFNQ